MSLRERALGLGLLAPLHLVEQQRLLAGVGLRVEGVGFWVLGFGLGVWGVGFRV